MFEKSLMDLELTWSVVTMVSSNSVIIETRQNSVIIEVFLVLDKTTTQ